MMTAMAALVLAACGGGGDTTAPGDDGTAPPPPPPPAAVDASVVLVDASAVHTNQFTLKVTLHLRNDGDAGVYKVQLWGYPTAPNGEDEFFGETDPVEVTADYEENLTATFVTEHFVRYVLVFTRNAGSAVYRQTAHFDFPTE